MFDIGVMVFEVLDGDLCFELGVIFDGFEVVVFFEI